MATECGKTTPSRKINTFVFLDLETTDLYKTDRPKIIELCMVAVHRSSLVGEEVPTAELTPRILDKLTLCFYPNKTVSDKSYELTGLDNRILEENMKKTFDDDAVAMLRLFLGRQKEPICLVAHNGDNFDFQLLRTEVGRLGQHLPDTLRCGDTLKALREIDNPSESTGRPNWARFLDGGPRYRLEDVYSRCFGSAITNKHNAESDAIALLQIVKRRAKDVCGWMDTNSVDFARIDQYYIPSPPKRKRSEQATPRSDSPPKKHFNRELYSELAGNH